MENIGIQKPILTNNTFIISHLRRLIRALKHPGIRLKGEGEGKTISVSDILKQTGREMRVKIRRPKEQHDNSPAKITSGTAYTEFASLTARIRQANRQTVKNTQIMMRGKFNIRVVIIFKSAVSEDVCV